MELSENLKQFLKSSPEIIVEILEELEFNDIRYGNGEIRASLPDGDNETSVHIRLNDFLSTNVYTRNEFADKFQFNDFISLIQYVTKRRFHQAYEYLCHKCGIESDYVPLETPTLLKIIRHFKTREQKTETIVPKGMLEQYPTYIVDEWVGEGIPSEIQKIYDIRIDKQRKRWLIPSYNEDGNLVTVQGRTYLENHKELKLPKYIYYKFGEGSTYNSNLFGLNVSKDDILEKKEVILFEGAKSVMKAYSWGYKNSLATQGCNITDLQLKKILALRCNVVLAFDKDKTFKDIEKTLKEFSRYTNTYYILGGKLLDEKDSPVDKGQEVWEELYKNKIKYG